MVPLISFPKFQPPKNLITDLTILPVPVPGGSPGSSPSTICGTLYSQSELARLIIIVGRY